MGLNGWQRLWVLAALLWAVVIVAFVALLQGSRDQAVPLTNAIVFVVLLWVVPVAVTYALGSGIAWVVRGFRAKVP